MGKLTLWAGVLVFGALGCGKEKLGGVNTALVAQPIDFGTVALGGAQNATLHLTNETAAAIYVRGVSAQPPFVGTRLATPLEIAAGGTGEVKLAFAPSMPGAQEQIASVDCDADSAPGVLLRGFGASYALTVSPEQLQFGALPLQTTRTLAVLLKNDGNVPLTPRLAGLRGSDASQFAAGSMPSIPARGQATLQVTASSARIGPLAASLAMSACDGCAVQSVSLNANGVASSLVVQPAMLDFGSVALGANTSQTIQLTNMGQTPLHVQQAFVTSDSDTDFTTTNEPLALAPSATVQLTVGFAPVEGGARHGTLRIVSDDPDAPREDIPLQGAGNQLAGDVEPRAIDFGTLAVGMHATQYVTLTNTSATGQLTLRSARITAGAHFAGGSDSAQVLEAGASTSVPVVYAPNSPGADTGTLEIVTDEGGSTTIDVALAGKAAQLAPCQWAARPSALDFGTVSPGESLTRGVDLINEGSGDCAVADISITPSSDPAFNMPDGAVAAELLHPGEWTTLRIAFTPSQPESASGTLQFFVSDPQNPVGAVSLSGLASTSCLALVPRQLDFGTAAAICPAPVQSVTARNTCDAPVSITSVGIGDGDTGEFTIASGNTGAHLLAAGASEQVSVQYAPLDDSLDLQSVVFTLGDGSRRLAGLQGVGETNPTHTDHFAEPDRAQVDHLFVIDNSGSMADKQDALAANMNAFLSEALAENTDFHIAVTSTGLAAVAGTWTMCPGGGNGGEDGRLFPVDNSTPRILTSTTPNLQAAFSADVHVGTCHWLEQGLEAARLALSQPLIGEVDDPDTQLPNDGNAGFLRPNARLSITIVSDADDQSDDALAAYESFFTNLKGGAPGSVVFSGIVTPDNKSSTCPSGESSGDRYMQLAHDTGGFVGNVCDTDWGTMLAQLSMSAFGPTTTFPLSARPSDPTQITVTVNGQGVTSGWSYDASANAIIFEAQSAPQSGSGIDVTYPVGC